MRISGRDAEDVPRLAGSARNSLALVNKIPELRMDRAALDIGAGVHPHPGTDQYDVFVHTSDLFLQKENKCHRIGTLV